MIERFLMT